MYLENPKTPFYCKPYISVLGKPLTLEQIKQIRGSSFLLILTEDEGEIKFTDDEPGIWANGVVSVDNERIHAERIGYFRPFYSSSEESRQRIENKLFIPLENIDERRILIDQQARDILVSGVHIDLAPYKGVFI